MPRIRRSVLVATALSHVITGSSPSLSPSLLRVIRRELACFDQRQPQVTQAATSNGLGERAMEYQPSSAAVTSEWRVPSPPCAPLPPLPPPSPSTRYRTYPPVGRPTSPNATAASRTPSEGPPGSPEPRNTPFHSLLLFGLSSFNYGRLVVEEFELL